MKRITLFIMLLLIGSVYAQSNIKVGQRAPDIHVSHWIENVPSDKTLTNKFIVLEFWATWCGPCIAAVPHMNEIQDKYQREDLYFISLTDESVEKVQRTLGRIDFKSIVATDLSKRTFIEFGNGKDGLDTYPLAVLIDKEGLVRWIGEPKQLDNATMDAFLNESAASDPSKQEAMNTPERITYDFRTLLTANEKTYHFEFYETDAPAGAKMAMGSTIIDFKGQSLADIYTEIFKVEKVVVPQTFAEKRYNLLYKNTDQSSAQDRLQEEILQKLGLTIRQETRPTLTYEVATTDPAKLEKTLELEFSSKSDAGDKLIFTAYSIGSMLEEVSKIHQIPFTYKGENLEKYDFIMDINSIDATIKCLGTYGMEHTERLAETQYSILEEKH